MNKDHAWFVGFAPADDPKIVVAVLLEFGEHGYRAARIASKIIGTLSQGRTDAGRRWTRAELMPPHRR